MTADPSKENPSRTAAYTLLELVVTMAVATILATIAAPTFEHWQARQRMNAAIQSLQQDLLTARSTAITLGINMVVCPGTVATGCEEGSDWSRGWLVFQDIDGDRHFGRSEPLIRQTPGFDRMAIRSSTSRRSLRFLPNGSAPGSNGSIWFCGSQGPENAWRVVLSNTGRIRREPYDGLEDEDCPEA